MFLYGDVKQFLNCCRFDYRLRIKLKDNSSYAEETSIKLRLNNLGYLWTPGAVLRNALKLEKNSFTNLDVLSKGDDDMSYIPNGTFRLFGQKHKF